MAGTAIEISSEGEFRKFWAAHGAGLHENISGTAAYLKIENISRETIDHPIIYGEYFDSLGRFCFSIMFAQDPVHEDGRSTVLPGEMRELYGRDSGLAPASAPTQLHLHLVQQGLLGEPTSQWNTRLRIPVTLGAAIPETASKIQLNELGVTHVSGSDVVLAKVTVTASGIADTVEVLESASSQAAAWFKGFAAQLTFFPATDSGVAKLGHALVLVRVAIGRQTLQESPDPAWDSPWVRKYLEATGHADDIRPVTKIIFEPTVTEAKLGLGILQQTFNVSYLGSDWGQPVFGWMRDLSAPHHMRRYLKASVSQ